MSSRSKAKTLPEEAKKVVYELVRGEFRGAKSALPDTEDGRLLRQLQQVPHQGVVALHRPERPGVLCRSDCEHVPAKAGRVEALLTRRY